MLNIGMPRGLFYYQYSSLWESFFSYIDCNVVLSDETNKRILDFGVECCSNDVCLPVKAFHGHVQSLLGKADYIFIPRYTSTCKNEFTCPKFCGLPDMVIYNLKNRVKLLEVAINEDKSPQLVYESLKQMARLLGKPYSDAVNAYEKATREFHHQQNKKVIKPVRKVIKPAIAILGHPYMIYDNYLSMNLISKLSSKGFEVYTPECIDKDTRRKNAYPYQGKVFWDVGLDNLGTAFTFALDRNIKGFIYLTPFACGIDSIVAEFIELQLVNVFKVPLLKLTVDEHTGEAGFDTRLEAFLDMIGGLQNEDYLSTHGEHVHTNQSTVGHCRDRICNASPMQ